MKKSSRTRSIAIVVCLAIVATFAAIILIVKFLSPERTTVYLFREGHKAGTKITADMLSPMQVDSRMIMSGNETTLSGYFVTNENYATLVKPGATLRYDVGIGKPFMAVDIATYGTNEIEVRLTETNVGVTVPVNSVNGVTPSMMAESHVNVYATQKNGLTQLILENIRVISVSSGQTGLTGLTLDLNNDQAIAVISAMNTGTIYLGLVNANGYQYYTQEYDQFGPPDVIENIPENTTHNDAYDYTSPDETTAN